MPPPFTRQTDYVDYYDANDVNELQVVVEDHETRIDVLEAAPAVSAITVQDEGTPLATDATTLNFVGAGVTATGSGATKTITIPAVSGGSGASDHEEDTPHVSGDTGTFVVAVRNDAGASLVSADGDYAPLSTDAAGNLRIGGALTLSGEDHVGDVSANPPALVTPAVTVSTSPAYSIGDSIGGKITLTNALRVSSGGAEFVSLTIFDAANQGPGFDLVLFDANPAGSFTDNAAVAWNTADFAKVLGVLTVATADYKTIASRKVATLPSIGWAIRANGSQTLYAVLVATGTPTFAATSNLTLRFGFARS